jgi:hypothetical protein
VHLVEAGQLDFQKLDLATDTLSGWQKMAARDGALTIYHFGKTIDAIWQSLPSCPALMTLVNESALRQASKEFRTNFPRYEAIRHVIGHTAEFSATPAQKEAHSIKGPWESPHVKIFGGARTQFSGNLYDRTYYVTFEGEVHGYEISMTTGDRLRDTKAKIHNSFAAVIMTP